METIKRVALSFEEKKACLKEIFEEISNPDRGLTSRKCVMQHWYEIRPGLRNNSETLFFGIREHDSALCAFDKLPHGTENDGYFHVFDSHPIMEIIPLENNVGCRLLINKRDHNSHDTLSEIAVLEEIVAVYRNFMDKYNTYLSTKPGQN